jgi:arginase
MRVTTTLVVAGCLACLQLVGSGQAPGRPVQVSLLRMPYVGERNVAELSPAPDAVVAFGLPALLHAAGATVEVAAPIRLLPADEKQYGAWQRLALANGHLAEAVADGVRSGRVVVGLLANCSSLLGMLGGVQHSGPSAAPLRVGLVYIDAHGDFNTPETTLSGMLGGMDVAAAAGLCLTRLRTTSRLDPAVPAADMILAGVRDTDPLEQELIDRHGVPRVSVDDLRMRSPALRAALERLSSRVDRIYVHIDMDVLDPTEVPGHSLNVPNGPTSAQLAAVVAEMFRNPKTVAIGIASTPTGDRDPDGRSRRAAGELVRAAVSGARQR